VNERTAVAVGALVGSFVGAFTSYLFFTEGGRAIRSRIEPAVDDLRHEFMRFQSTFAKVGEMASEGMRVVHEFNEARASRGVPGGPTSH
jgi:hypothetical protein